MIRGEIFLNRPAAYAGEEDEGKADQHADRPQQVPGFPGPVLPTHHNKIVLTFNHRRRMELEDKTKVVASVWGAKFVQFLSALAVLSWSI